MGVMTQPILYTLMKKQMGDNLMQILIHQADYLIVTFEHEMWDYNF